MSNFKNLANQKFGYLTAIKRAPDYIQANGRHRTMWLCKCKCGNTAIVGTDQLTGNYTKSCGCFHIKRAKDANTKHGLEGTRIYRIWRNVKTRCLNKNNKRYKDYGERGIKICTKWLDFQGFYEDMGKSYEKHIKNYGEKNTSIDRKDTNKGYYKENCKWSTLIQQANNKRNNHYITFNGETLSLSQTARKYHLTKAVLTYRINNGWSVEKSLTK